jgi:hypothetical protein
MFLLAWTKVCRVKLFVTGPLLNVFQHPSDGRALLVNIRRAIVLHHHNFKKAVKAIQFSPDGKYDSRGLLYHCSESYALDSSGILL